MRRDHVLQFVLEAAQTPDFQGVTAQAVADALSIWRNDAAVELNKLVAEGKLRQVGKKKRAFLPSIGGDGGHPAGAKPCRRSRRRQRRRPDSTGRSPALSARTAA